MVRRTKAEAEATRAAILDAAEHVFLERGVARTSLEEIARSAHLTRGAIYWHFKNKADLLGAMMERVRLPIESLIEELEQRDGGDPLTVLRGAVQLLLQNLAENEQYRRVYTIYYHRFEQVDEFADSDARACSAMRSANHALCALFERAELRGQLRATANPSVAAMVVRLFLIGLYTDWLREPQRYDIELWGLRALDGLLEGFIRERAA